jgi:type III secretion protein L
MAERIIDELRLNPQTLNNICQKVLNRAQGAKKIRLRLNPKDFEAQKENIEQIIHSFGYEDFEVCPDIKIHPGGCILESELGIIDACLETQLEALKEIVEKTKAR